MARHKPSITSTLEKARRAFGPRFFLKLNRFHPKIARQREMFYAGRKLVE
jgi:hypothetical protein